MIPSIIFVRSDDVQAKNSKPIDLNNITFTWMRDYLRNYRMGVTATDIPPEWKGHILHVPGITKG